VFKWLVILGQILSDEIVHFLLAFAAGWAVYWLTSTICSALLLAWERGTQKQASSGVVYCIRISALLLAFSAALLSHCWLDQLVIWYNSPLNPPLDLVVR